jgi:ATP-dependent DNA helicase RecG
MLKAGKEPPFFESAEFLATAILPGGIGNDAFVRFVADLPEELGRDVEVLLALDLLRSEKTLHASKLSGAIQRSPYEAQNVLQRLAEDRYAILEPTRSTSRKPFPSYRLRSGSVAALDRALSYQRRTSDEIDAKAVAHIREYGYITNRTLQRIFDIHVYAARDMLADLRSRGLIEKIGDARGGPNVRYGRGPRFPKSATTRRQARDQKAKAPSSDA